MEETKHPAKELVTKIEIMLSAHKISKQELAKKVNYNRRTIYDWMNNPERHHAKLIMLKDKLYEIVRNKTGLKGNDGKEIHIGDIIKYD